MINMYHLQRCRIISMYYYGIIKCLYISWFYLPLTACSTTSTQVQLKMLHKEVIQKFRFFICIYSNMLSAKTTAFYSSLIWCFFYQPSIGIADLKSGKIVTPLPPKQTFLDDPLRVLRAIRFGSPRKTSDFSVLLERKLAESCIY